MSDHVFRSEYSMEEIENNFKDSDFFNPILQESPPSKRSERWRGMEKESSGMIRLRYEEVAG